MSEESLEELRTIKKLLVLLLVKAGASTDEIGLAVGSKATASRLIPGRKVKRFATSN